MLVGKQLTEQRRTGETGQTLAKEHQTIGVHKVVVAHDVDTNDGHQDIAHGNQGANEYHEKHCHPVVFDEQRNGTAAQTAKYQAHRVQDDGVYSFRVANVAVGNLSKKKMSEVKNVTKLVVPRESVYSGELKAYLMKRH